MGLANKAVHINIGRHKISSITTMDLLRTKIIQRVSIVQSAQMFVLFLKVRWTVSAAIQAKATMTHWEHVSSAGQNTRTAMLVERIKRAQMAKSTLASLATLGKLSPLTSKHVNYVEIVVQTVLK